MSKNILKIISFIIIIIIMIASPIVKSYADELDNENDIAPIVFESEDCIVSTLEEIPTINAHAGIVIDMETGRVLFEKNAYNRMAMASTTKIMTAILAIEKGGLEDEVTVSKLASNIRGSIINLQAGEQIKLKDLLYGLLLNSGNDAAIAIAEHIGGSLENFLEMMNYKAKLLGARNTNFKSPHGLDSPGHYSTAYDLAVITRYALKNPIFSEIVKTKSANIGHRSLYNTNEMLDIYPGADGVKTGYTGQAGRCLVTSATRDGNRFISVILNSPSRTIRAQSSKKILDYAFTNYKTYTLLDSGTIVAKLPVIKGVDYEVQIEAVDEISLPLKIDEYNRVEKKIILPSDMEAPIYAGIDVGTIQFILDDKLLGQSELKTLSDIRRKDFKYYFELILDKWYLLAH